MLSPGVPWIIVVILSAQGYPFYNRNYYNYNNYYRHRNPYNRHPDLELKRLKRCVNQWSPDMRMYNFMQNPSACGSSLVNDLSRITPEQLNCLMKILEGSESCSNWPQGTNNSPSFQSGIPQQHPMTSYKRSNKSPVLRPQAIHPSLLEGWVSDEDTHDLPGGGYRPFNQGVGPSQMRNIIQSEYAQRQNAGSLKAGSILVIVPAQDQIDEDQESQIAQTFYNAPPPVAPPPLLPPTAMLPSHNAIDWNAFNTLSSQNKALISNPPLASNIMHGSPPLMDLNPMYSNSIPAGMPSITGGIPSIPGGMPSIPWGIPAQNGDYQSYSLIKSNPPLASNIMHASPPKMDYPPPTPKNLPPYFSNIIQGSQPIKDYQPPSMHKDTSPLVSNIMHGTPQMAKDTHLQDPNIMQGSQPTLDYEPSVLMPNYSPHLASNIMYEESPVMGYQHDAITNTNPSLASNIINEHLPFMDYNSINHKSLSGGLSAYLQGVAGTTDLNLNSPYIQNIPKTQNIQPSPINVNTPYIQNIPNTQNTYNVQPSLMNMNSGLNCGPWANAWEMGMYPYTGLCFNPYGSLLGQRFDQLRAVTEAYQNVDEPEIEINQTTTCKKKGKDGKWVPCDPEDLERNLPSLYNNNYGNANPAQVIPVWDGSMDTIVPELGPGIQSGLPSAPGGPYNQVPSYTTGTPDVATQGGGLLSGLSSQPLPQGLINSGLNYGQPVTGIPPALTQMTTPIKDSMIQSERANTNSVSNLETNLGGLVMNGGYTTTINPYNQGLVWNDEIKSNNVSPYDPGPAGRYNPAFINYNPMYAAISHAEDKGSEREGRIISGNMNQNNLLSTDRPGRSIAPPLQLQNYKSNNNLLMGQGNSPIFIPSKSIPAIPLYTGFNKIGDPSRMMNMMPYGQPMYIPQMIPNGQHVQYPYFTSSPVAYSSNQSPHASRWVPMKIDRTPQISAQDNSKTESLENSNIDDTDEIEESIEESNDY